MKDVSPFTFCFFRPSFLPVFVGEAEDDCLDVDMFLPFCDFVGEDASTPFLGPFSRF